MIGERHPHDRAGAEGAVPVDRRTIALAGVRAARHELCRAHGLLRRAIALAATQDVSPEQLATAAGSSVDQIQRIVTEIDDAAGANARTRSARDARGAMS